MSDLAPELRNRVVIQAYTEPGRDEDGFPIEGGWSEYKKLWAKVTPLSAKDLIAAQADQYEVVARMKIRYREDITTKMQVLWKGRVFSIKSQALDDSEDSYTYCTFLLGQGLEKPK
ncbi:phage head closure protein [Acinetobacter baumannii]|uniref:phage head closure protein n=1 Tax=Acinetobacter baumannii TaxID=470 RepID=UPI003891CA63